MIGFYDYTVWLTYLSFVSASTGIYMTLAYDAPVIGIICLLISGLCDAFDGKVAATKKERTDREKKYGIQIDSLSDVVAFGVLPGIIGMAEFRKYIADNPFTMPKGRIFISVFVFIITVVYMLAAYIRLAYYNVEEEERQNHETGRRFAYRGLPVTSVALIFPLLYIVQEFSTEIFVTAYFAVMLIVSFAFLLDIPVKKPGLRGVIILTSIGLAEFGILILFRYVLY